MDLIEDIISKNGGPMIADLVANVGMGTDQAEAFLPEVGSSLISALTSKAGDLDLSDLQSAGNVDRLMGAMDTAKLAAAAGITPEQGSRGLSRIVPMILSFLGERNGDDLLGMIARSGGLGDAVGKLKGLGKLFG